MNIELPIVDFILLLLLCLVKKALGHMYVNS